MAFSFLLFGTLVSAGYAGGKGAVPTNGGTLRIALDGTIDAVPLYKRRRIGNDMG
jgi:hypothetical protein